MTPVSNAMLLSELRTAQPHKVRLLEDTVLASRSSNLVPAIIQGMYVALATPLPDEEAEVYGVEDYRGVQFVDTAAQISSVDFRERLALPYVPPEADWESKMPLLARPKPGPYDVVSEIDFSMCTLAPKDLEILKDILRSHTDAFVGPDGQLGHYNGPIRHRIDLIKNAEIPARKIYRVPLEKRAEIERQIYEMLQNGIIRESNSPFCAPIVLVRKKDSQSWRFTIDFRGLNSITRSRQSILPNIQDIVDLCANQCLYTSLDFQQGFFQIPLEEKH
ncbi:unnamed protein product, partial [Cylicostephanus goldi]